MCISYFCNVCNVDMRPCFFCYVFLYSFFGFVLPFIFCILVIKRNYPALHCLTIPKKVMAEISNFFLNSFEFGNNQVHNFTEDKLTWLRFFVIVLSLCRGYQHNILACIFKFTCHAFRRYIT